MTFVDFASLKRDISIEQVITMLGLDLKKSGEQLRGPCPLHGGGDRALVVTPAKGLWYCFANECQAGGDMIELVAKVRKVSLRDAALAIQAHFNAPPASASIPDINLKPLDYLEPGHDAVKALGLSEETCRHFGAGYAGRGIMRGRIAVPILRGGILLAYVGLKKGEAPLYPKGFDPGSVIFNADNLAAGELHVTDHPLKVLVAHQHGIGNVVAVLAPLSPQLLHQLAGLMEGKGIAAAHLL